MGGDLDLKCFSGHDLFIYSHHHPQSKLRLVDITITDFDFNGMDVSLNKEQAKEMHDYLTNWLKEEGRYED